MSRSPDHVYLLLIVGRADIGIPTTRDAEVDAEAQRARLAQLSDGSADAFRRVLLQHPPFRDGTPRTAPLRAIVEALTDSEEYQPATLHLVLVSTEEVLPIAEAIRDGIATVPTLYGVEFADVTVAVSDSLVEDAVATATATQLRNLNCTPADRIVVNFGSGSTQAAIGAIEAGCQLGVPWSLAMVAPDQPAQLCRYSPTDGLPVDPLVPLLQRWRYHDLLDTLAEDGLVETDEKLRTKLRCEAERWGHAYTEPTADRLLGPMVAALMRRDGTSGFVVRAYVEQRYRQLHAEEGNGCDLLAWAKQQIARERSGRKGKNATLGRILGKVQKSTDDQVIEARDHTRSGQWLVSKTVYDLNELGKASAHELQPAQEAQWEALRAHLREVEQEQQAHASGEVTGDGAMPPAPLAPSRRVWYVAILGMGRSEDSAEQLRSLVRAVDDRSGPPVDPAVRQYLAVDSGETLPIGVLVLGTRSGTWERAKQLAAELHDDTRPEGRPALAVEIPDPPGGPSGQPGPVWSTDDAEAAVRERLGDDVGALVVIPTGPKVMVLPLLTATHRLAAGRGVPLYLRQLVDRDKGVTSAGLHRLPMRFGLDTGLLAAASHALTIGEWDTASRLLGATVRTPAPGDPSERLPAARELADRALALSRAMRCELPTDGWPPELLGERSVQELTVGLAGQRLAVWAELASGDAEVSTRAQAILGACASFESSVRGIHGHPRPQRLFRVRDNLPISHGAPVTDPTLAQLVRDHTGYSTVTELLRGSAEKAVELCGQPKDDEAQSAPPKLLDLVRQLKHDVDQLARQAR